MPPDSYCSSARLGLGYVAQDRQGTLLSIVGVQDLTREKTSFSLSNQPFILFKLSYEDVFNIGRQDLPVRNAKERVVTTRDPPWMHIIGFPLMVAAMEASFWPPLHEHVFCNRLAV
ncbi:hypothetical protein NDU88_000277 [Pleurodeles waltl]|uniref:Uncharacterized protein n=1 Tax=Pleurodeles waltl TaxID=8319 RepID=A0AAV7KMK0_PLEWA|nr:hypothetical protein NDU88_000277 [Pleurodeles waltl]